MTAPMTPAKHRGDWVIIISFFLSLMLMQLPMPAWAAPWRPAWVALILIYWCMAAPQRVGVAVAWMLGLLVDVLTGTLLGQHALGLSVIAFLTHKLHQRMRILPVWQQGISIFALVLCYQTLLLWINGIQGKPAEIWAYWLSPLTSTVLWPWVFVLLRDAHRKYGVS